MPDAKDSREAFEEASTKLNEGLKTCRAMVENYRSVLAADQQNRWQSDCSAIVLNANPSTPASGNQEELAVREAE